MVPFHLRLWVQVICVGEPALVQIAMAFVLVQGVSSTHINMQEGTPLSAR